MPDTPQQAERNPGTNPQAGDVVTLSADPEFPALVERVHMDSLDTGTVYVRHAQADRNFPLAQWRKTFEQGGLLPWSPPQQNDGGETLPDVAPVTLEPQNAGCPSTGGSGSLSVTLTGPGAANSWSVDPQAEATSWFHVTDPAIHTPQPANGIVHWSADPNASASERSGALYINGKTFTLRQAAQQAR